MTYADLLDILESRAERLGLAAPGGQADAAELELLLFHALISLVELVDLQEYLRNNTLIATTTNSQADYAMPDDYGRMVKPRVRNRRGIFLNDTVQTHDLEYLNPEAFSRKTSFTNGKPEQFSIIGRQLWLYTTPDTNGGSDYTIRGVYVVRVDRPQLEDPVLLRYPMALVEQTLFTLASDAGKLTDGLVAGRQEALQRLTGGVM